MEELELKEQLLCIDDNKEALAWRIRLIDMADSSLILTTFDFIGDECGLDIMAAIYGAQSRGVHVRILMDAVNGWRHLRHCRPFWFLASLPGIEIRYYNPFHKIPLYKINYRLHDKFLIADDKAYILGGRNLCDVSLDSDVKKPNIDRDILAFCENGREFPSMYELKQYFEAVWSLPFCKPVKNSGTDSYSVEKTMLHERYTQKIRNQYPADFCDITDRMIRAARITLLHNPTDISKKEPLLWNKMFEEMACGKEILIQTPYMICNNKMYRDLNAVSRTGARVMVITNSPQTGANPWGCCDYMNQKHNILKTGSEICEYSGRESLHTKTVLIDSDTCIVGSFNMDMRSAYLDTELMLLIRSPELNTGLRETADMLTESSLHLYPDGSKAQGAEYEYRPMKPAKRVFYSGIRLLCIVAWPGRKFL